MLYSLIDILGTIAFAISGVLVAMDKRLDVFGVFIIAFVTAVGGGTLRDVLIGNTPVGWMTQPNYTVIIIITVILSILFAGRLKHFRKSLFLFDTIGIGLYTMIGIQKGLDAGLMPIMCIALGIMTACFGGVIRDILCNEIPVIFRREIYATVCILGGGVYFLMLQFPVNRDIPYITGIICIIVLRLLAVKFKIALPGIYPK
ncbi:trimeric intracellular cation channel family protein [Maribacter litopenaei]|uniref:Trimeric intracellular cation channel family protein n=1 Tax=Maribacter litopenaei TaxID=2976127 RepID=A0ABY5Y7N2_9FLAO|nr:trimeric intracellular cation channel family protein [Maribacter litopenaei]UWX53986.1 trimeric intracellular cation channel family protein [Maribacter litopenaei]